MPANPVHAELTATLNQCHELLDLAFSEEANFPNYVRHNVRRTIVECFTQLETDVDDFEDDSDDFPHNINEPGIATAFVRHINTP